MTRRLFILMTIISLIAACCIVGGVGLITTGCSGGGGGGGQQEEQKSREDINAGPKSSYLLYSAYDGKDYEIYLLNISLAATPSSTETASAQTKAEGDAGVSSSAPSFEMIQLTNNDTNDIMPVGTGTTLAWHCDDGAGSELCVMDMYNKKFVQPTAVAGGGALGRTIMPEIHHLALSSDGRYVGANTDEDGRGGRIGTGMLRYDVAEGTLLLKKAGEILGAGDDFTSYGEGLLSLAPDGSTILDIYVGQPASRFSDVHFYALSAAGDFKKMEGVDYEYLFTYKGSWLAIGIVGGDQVFGAVDPSSGAFSSIASLGKQAVYPCQSRGEIRVIATSGVAPAFVPSLYVYDDAAKQLKLLKDNISGTFGECFQSEDGGKALIIAGNGDVDTYTLLDIASGAESQVYSKQKDENRIAISSDLNAIAFNLGEKLTLVDTASKATTEIEGSAMDGYFINGSMALVFNIKSGDSFLYDIQQKKMSPLPMPAYPDYEFDQNSLSSPPFVLMRKQECTAKLCGFYDDRASTSYKLYRVDSGDTIDIPSNGKDIVSPAWIELTAGQYAAWKAAAGDTAFRDSAKPSADSGGPALQLCGVVSLFGYTAHIVKETTNWGEVQAFAYSRQPGSNIAWKVIVGGAEGAFVPTQLDKEYRPLGRAIGLWPSAVHVINLAEAGAGAVDILSQAKDGDIVTVRAGDGTATVEEKLRVVFRQAPEQRQPPPPPPQAPQQPQEPGQQPLQPMLWHPPQMSVMDISGRQLNNGGTVSCYIAATKCYILVRATDPGGGALTFNADGNVVDSYNWVPRGPGTGDGNVKIKTGTLGNYSVRLFVGDGVSATSMALNVKVSTVQMHRDQHKWLHLRQRALSTRGL